MIKLLFPDGKFEKSDLAEILSFALEMRRRVKEQLKKIGGMEFYDVNFSYIDRETGEETFVTVAEQGSSSLIPSGTEKPGFVYAISYDQSERLSLFKLETQQTPGSGRLEKTGVGSNRASRESMDTGMRYLLANYQGIDQRIMPTKHDYVVDVANLTNTAMTEHLGLATFIALISISVKRPTLDSLVVLGDMTLGGTLVKVANLADSLQVAKDSGAKNVLLPTSALQGISSVPNEVLGAFKLIPYNSIDEAAFKAFGMA